jgi:hypothetical protein
MTSAQLIIRSEGYMRQFGGDFKREWATPLAGLSAPESPNV